MTTAPQYEKTKAGAWTNGGTWPSLAADIHRSWDVCLGNIVCPKIYVYRITADKRSFAFYRLLSQPRTSAVSTMIVGQRLPPSCIIKRLTEESGNKRERPSSIQQRRKLNLQIAHSHCRHEGTKINQVKEIITTSCRRIRWTSSHV